MKYKVEHKIARRSFEHFKDINDEYIYRELAMKLVSDMSLEDLKKLIQFEKHDPKSEEGKSILENPHTQMDEQYALRKRELLKDLEQTQAILFKAKIYIQ